MIRQEFEELMLGFINQASEREINTKDPEFTELVNEYFTPVYMKLPIATTIRKVYCGSCGQKYEDIKQSEEGLAIFSCGCHHIGIEQVQDGSELRIGTTNRKEVCHELIRYQGKLVECRKVIEQDTQTNNFPEIVCLCGSTRFFKLFNEMNVKFTLEGKIVLSIGDHYQGDHDTIYENYKPMLQELHFRKIDLADKVFIINKNGYIGESTRSEIEYAKKIGKPIEYLEGADRE